MNKLTPTQESIANGLRDKGVPPEWAIILAIKNGKMSGAKAKAYLTCRLADCVAAGFTWDASGEGYAYWRSLDDAFIAEAKAMQ